MRGLAQGHLDTLLPEEPGSELATFLLAADPLCLLKHMPPQVVIEMH